jgi:molybdopterin synthase catalytic subunit
VEPPGDASREASVEVGAVALRSTSRIRTEPLSLDEIVREVRHAGAGAVVTFEGTVRDTNDGRSVTLLEYEAYGPMAETELVKVLDEIRAEHPEVRVAAVHRIGALHVGDAAVLCAASAPHRAEAFRACRSAIDRIKSRLPIWKREHGPEGPYWVGWEDARCAPDGHEHAHVHDRAHPHDH